MSLLALVLTLFGAAPGEAWPAFRGTGDSLTAARDLPLRWDADTNRAWAVDLPGYGQSSPVVWKDAVFVTSAAGESKETLIVACYDLATGEPRWRKEFPSSQPVKVSNYVSRSAPTPAVDAERVYAFFESGDLVALDHAGTVQWQRSLTKDYGPFQGNHGLGSSPALTDEAVVLLIDHSGPSYLLAIDKATGKTLWKTDRTERVSWSSPVVVPGEEGPQILVNSNGTVEAYAAADGARLWWIDGLEKNTVSSPTPAGDLVIVGSSQVGHNLAVRRGGKGDVAGTHVAWKTEDATSSFASPLVYRNRVYYVNKAGVAYCLDLPTGKPLWTKRLPDSCWASPLGADGRVYFFCKDGRTVVANAGDQYEELAENSLPTDDRVYGVAAVDGAFVLRMGSKLICVGTPQAAKP